MTDVETERLRRLAADSQDRDALLGEFVFRDKWARFDIDFLELEHLPMEEIWRRHIAPALKAIGAPTGYVKEPAAELASAGESR